MLYRYSFDSPVGCLRLEEEDGYLAGLHFDPDPSVRYADDTDLLRHLYYGSPCHSVGILYPTP